MAVGLAVIRGPGLLTSLHTRRKEAVTEEEPLIRRIGRIQFEAEEVGRRIRESLHKLEEAMEGVDAIQAALTQLTTDVQTFITNQQAEVASLESQIPDPSVLSGITANLSALDAAVETANAATQPPASGGTPPAPAGDGPDPQTTP